VVETEFRVRSIQPDGFGSLKQSMGAHDVGVYKGIRAVDRAVDVGFGCKVDYGIDLFALQQIYYEVVIPDISMYKTKPGMIFHRGKVAFVSRIGQGIEHYYLVIRIVLDPVMYKIGANKTGTTGNEERVRSEK
jgi:hypothetical protein